MKLTLHQRLIKLSIYRALIRIILAVLLKVLFPIKSTKELIVWIYSSIKTAIVNTRASIISELKFASETAQAFEEGTKKIPKVPENIIRRFWNRLIFQVMPISGTSTGSMELCDTMDVAEFGVSLDKEEYERINTQLLERSREANKIEIPGQRKRPDDNIQGN